MRKHIQKVFGLATSATAKDTYVLFSGNLLAAILGFLFTLIIARALSVEDFGVYSAAQNLIVIIISLTDLGISSGIVNFISSFYANKEKAKEFEYTKAAFLIKVVASIIFCLPVAIFASFVSKNWLATGDTQIALWVAVISFTSLFWSFSPYVMQAKKFFLKSVIIDMSISLPKLVIPFIFLKMGVLNIRTTLLAFALSSVLTALVGFLFTGISFLKSKPKKEVYLDLFKFSGWLGVNRFISSISGRLDIQMLAAISGALATGLYSIPSKLASFIIVLASSYSAVLAPRFASFGNKKEEWKYILKSCLALIPIIGGIIFVIVFAKPFILILFGQKYIGSVPVFQALSVSMIPFMITVPSVTAIIYSIKKTIFIGGFSIFQLIAIFLLNYIYIPKVGAFGPTIAFGVVFTILAIYSWIIVIRYYSPLRKNTP